MTLCVLTHLPSMLGASICGGYEPGPELQRIVRLALDIETSLVIVNENSAHLSRSTIKK